MPRVLYDEDFFLWIQEQAALLRDKKLTELDLDNLAEEMESLGKCDRRELESWLRVLMTHLLKGGINRQSGVAAGEAQSLSNASGFNASSAIARACTPKCKPLLTVNILTLAPRHLMKPGF